MSDTVRTRIRESLPSRLFDAANVLLLALFALLTSLPLLHIVASSFQATEQLLARSFILFPTRFSFDAYRYIFTTSTLPRSLWVTVQLTVIGTFMNLLLTTLTAFPLAHRWIPGRRALMFGVTFTMLFSGGMIPTFLVVKGLGLINSFWAMILPGAISAFNLIVLKNFFQELPSSLEESALIDGCNDFTILMRIIVPLSKPALATFGLFYAVANWNIFMPAILYINDNRKWPIQVLLRNMVILSSGAIGDSSSLAGDYIMPPQTVKMAIIVVSTLPILLVYPFVQKHFTKGILVGSIKG